MPTTFASTTQAQEASTTRPQLLVRTTQFLKKVSNFRTNSRKASSFNSSPELATLQRSARSMDLGSKALTKVDVRAHHSSFDQSRDSDEESPSHVSLRASTPSHQIDGIPNTTNPLRPPPPASSATPSLNGHVQRFARPTDVGSKALTQVDVRAQHHSFDQSRDSDEDSPSHVSLWGSSRPNRTSSSTPDFSAGAPLRQIEGIPHTTNPLRPPISANELPSERSQMLPSRSPPPASTATVPSANGHVQRPARSTDLGSKAPESPPLRQIDGVPHTTRLPISANELTPLTSVHERSQTLPSASSATAPTVNGHVQAYSTLNPSARRALAPRLATLPPPLMAQYTAGGSARLTPSLVTRQPPMPLMNLPTLPPASPSQPPRQTRRNAPLRSLPALPMRGPGDADGDADHENASLEEEDEEEDEHAGSAEHEHEHEPDSDDSSNEDDTSPLPSSSSLAGPSRLPSLPGVDTSAFRVSFGGADATARATSSIDYFTSKPPESGYGPSERTPRPSDFDLRAPGNGKARAVPDRAGGGGILVPQPRIVAMPLATPGSPARPNLYHHASKSMVDLMSLARKDKDTIISPKLGRTPPKTAQGLVSPKSASPAVPAATVPTAVDADKEESAPPPPAPPPESPDDVITSPMLRRRRSLPVYEPSSDPPPYPDPLFRRRPAQAYAYAPPPEEEGTEPLPPYTNAIFLAGAMPRKMEFTAPGVQAKDRKWRRVYCVLEGTAFRVYKAPPAASRVGALEQWWESKVGAGDSTSVDSSAVTASGIRVSAVRERRERERERERAGEAGAEERIPKIPEETTPTGAEQPPSSASANGQQETELPSTKSRLALTSRFLRRQRSKSSTRPLAANSTPPRMSMDSRVSDPAARHPSHTAGRHSMDTLGSARPSIATSASGSTSTSAVPSVPASASASMSGSGSGSASGSSVPTSMSESASRFSRRSFLPHSSSSTSSAGGGGGKDKEREKEKEEVYVPDAKDLIKQYTLQHAESGLASDYVKRKNVIRVRMMGEQFLLQAKDVAAVVDWIEGIQMGTNVALDLDERPMPRGPIFPRCLQIVIVVRVALLTVVAVLHS
ncbi:hypothetical protein BD309DRAFT_968454 [Dichomitus squalens]|uniref:Uncharacterized protein n=1 Tax=Dichomitus squalens TaxID=114155 RepID=A0A4Q9NJQ6_9APHY|nr:hypothetical protein BD309DRAFT_968454 [Dichomitus squalens]TBU53366.1 hypothetical protein BD310DRAFT_160345 [Dichomitus squalens]